MTSPSAADFSILLLSSTSSLIPFLSAAHDPILTSPVLTCLPSFLFSRPPEPNTCVSSEFQERRPGCLRKQSVTSSLPLVSYLTQPACLPSGEPELPQRLCFWRGLLLHTLSLFRKLGTFLSLLYRTYTHIQTQLGAHSCTHRHRNKL